MKQRNISYKILLLLITSIFFLISCNSKSEKSIDIEEDEMISSIPGLLEIDENNPKTVGFRYLHWDGVLDKKGFNPLHFVYPIGPVKTMKVWGTETQGEDTERELILIKEYEDKGKISERKTFHYGDESSWNYYYDSFQRLIKIEESYNGVVVSERELTYNYLSFDSEENKVAREVYKNSKLIQIETEQIVDNRISLEIDFTDKKTTETDSLYYENGNVVKYVDAGNFRFGKKFIFNEYGKLIKTIEFDDEKKEMFIYDYKYNKDGNIIEGITNDYRHNPPTIMRTEKAMNHDQHGNWLRKELYEDDILVAYIEREILYY